MVAATLTAQVQSSENCQYHFSFLIGEFSSIAIGKIRSSVDPEFIIIPVFIRHTKIGIQQNLVWLLLQDKFDHRCFTGNLYPFNCNGF